MLVVQLKKPDEWIARLKPGCEFDPRRGSNMPFAALVDSSCADIHTLQKALPELKAQMAGEHASPRPALATDPLSDTAGIPAPITFGHHVEQ
jgi:hypothetical protein